MRRAKGKRQDKKTVGNFLSKSLGERGLDAHPSVGRTLKSVLWAALRRSPVRLVTLRVLTGSLA